MRRRIVMSGLFVLGIVFRFWVISLVPQPFILDQTEYHRVAEGILSAPAHIFVSSFRMYGYPAILAMFYSVFGELNVFPIIFFQVVLDAMVGLMIFYVAKRLFKNETAAWIGFAVYTLNPFTSAYLGVRLTEAMTVFFVMLAFFLYFQFIRRRQTILAFALAAVLGFLPQIRPGYLYFSILMAAFLLVKVLKIKEKLRKKVFVTIGIACLFAVPFLYSIIGNLRQYQQFSVMSVDNLFIREFYISLYIDGEERITFIPKEVNWIYQQYSAVNTRAEREAMSAKFMAISQQVVWDNPKKFFIDRIKKLGIVWEKHRLFPYGNDLDPKISPYVYWGNIIFLTLGLAGIVLYVRKHTLHSFEYLTLFFFLYTSVVHAFTITAERFSLPAYPLVCMWAGFGTWSLLNIFRRHGKSS